MTEELNMSIKKTASELVKYIVESVKRNHNDDARPTKIEIINIDTNPVVHVVSESIETGQNFFKWDLE